MQMGNGLEMCAIYTFHYDFFLSRQIPKMCGLIFCFVQCSSVEICLNELCTRAHQVYVDYKFFGKHFRTF